MWGGLSAWCSWARTIPPELQCTAVCTAVDGIPLGPPSATVPHNSRGEADAKEMRFPLAGRSESSHPSVPV